MNKILLVYIILTLFFGVIIASWAELIVENIRKKIMKKKKEYPDLVCQECGEKASNGKQFQVSCWYKGECDICGKTKSVTEFRDFYYGYGKTLKECKKLIK